MQYVLHVFQLNKEENDQTNKDIMTFPTWVVLKSIHFFKVVFFLLTYQVLQLNRNIWWNTNKTTVYLTLVFLFEKKKMVQTHSVNVLLIFHFDVKVWIYFFSLLSANGWTGPGHVCQVQNKSNTKKVYYRFITWRLELKALRRKEW